ncbi:hypothetical protein HPB51_025859 [Rhipicephalus microplus]|uniref:UDP-D-xylose:beta-D-glucoside alpha-1,3-D-xylosyltransferase n=1 Tax=Rhipicephalus microplus TaxID=6941 RepID=A0A9J6F9F3_RHIMP|nr:hypothetical protein HPB51_025859 [Rhipicephalus microplus]
MAHLVRFVFVVFVLLAMCVLKYEYNNLWTNAPVDFPKAKKSQSAAPSLPQPSATAVTGGSHPERVKLVVVTCKGLLNMTVTNIKSAVAFTTVPLDLLLFADDENREPLRQASMLPDVDAVIYVDADVLFLSPIEELWKYFATMNSSHLAALAPESEDYATNWYRRFARHPFYQPLGVNSGVMLMNLTRMREFGWEKRLGPLLQKYSRDISWGDQDLLNILFSAHPERLLLFPCRWNYRTDHCMYGAYCTAGPPAVIHGSRRAFILESEPAFWGLHQAMEQYELGESLEYSFVVPFKDRLQRSRKTRCGQEFLKQVVHWEATARTIDIAVTNRSQKKES